MFAKPANVMVLDEPTNDLDAETLDLLEETLSDYPGTILLVSHDRAFLNNVVTSTIVFEGDGVVNEYDGGYDDWLRQKKGRDAVLAGNVRDIKASLPAAKSGNVAATSTARPRKLSYKDQRELDELPQLIEDLEARQAELNAQMADADFYKEDKDQILAVQKEAETTGKKLDRCLERWEGLEG